MTPRIETLLRQWGGSLFGADSEAAESAVQVFAHWYSRLEPSVRHQLRALFEVGEWLPLTTGFRHPLSRLSADALERLSVRVRDPYRATLLRLLKGLCGMAYLSSEPRARALGYPLLPSGEPEGTPADFVEVQTPAGSFTADYDVVVVGSGAGGATAARRLAEYGYRVGVVEEGPLATPHDTTQPLLERARRFYRRNGFTLAFGMPPVFLPMGRTVGGTTVINSGTCFRTPRFVLERWEREFGLSALNADSTEAYFEQIERELHISPVDDAILGGNGAVVRLGAERLGWRHHPLYRPQQGCRGTGICAFICPRHAKLDMRLSMLPLAQRHGAEVWAHCRVARVLIEKGRAVGVEGVILDAGGQPTPARFQFRARHVVLAGGAIATPVLLKRSGIRHPRIGRNLHLHPSVSVFAEMPEPVYGWRGVMQSYGVVEWLPEGTLIEATFPPLSVGYALHPLPFWGAEHRRLLERCAHLAAVGILTADFESEGRVYSPSFFTYRLSRRDAQRVQQGMMRAGQLFFAAGAEAVYSDIPGAECLRKPEELERWAAVDPRHLNLSAYHPGGTCCMGADPARCPVDEWGRVRGIENLWVADASLIPTPTIVNPQITIMMLALHVADALHRAMS
jgi:choline dehydrogenase-like flavoprotein